MIQSAAELLEAYQEGADLSGADLSGADLSCADLSCADLSCADLSRANLSDANLCDADLCDANLRDADLSCANLRGADLRGADLRGANLRDADLCGVNLNWAIGNNAEIKTIQTGTYVATFTKEVMAIGCKQHTLAEWWAFSDEQIESMDGQVAIDFWRQWKGIYILNSPRLKGGLFCG